MGKSKINWTDYVWNPVVCFKRLHGVDEKIVDEYVHYIVKRVAIADNIQHVNLIEL
jgi:protein gp37